MNCKQGDMAMIIKSMAGNEGKFVTCVRPVVKNYQFIGEMPSWEVDRELPTGNIFWPKVQFIPDAWLMPIRPGDMKDETTTRKTLTTG